MAIDLSISCIEVFTCFFNLNVNNIYSSKIVVNTARNTLVVIVICAFLVSTRDKIQSSIVTITSVIIDTYIYTYIHATYRENCKDNELIEANAILITNKYVLHLQ